MGRLKRQITKLLEMETLDLAGYLAGRIAESYGEKMRYATEDYIYAEGNIPVMLVAHMDTVFTSPPVVEEMTTGILTSKTGLGADDRAGIFAILKIIDDGYRPYVLFTNDEEIGCIGARKFTDRITADELTIDVNFMIELDRKGRKDAVFYDCDNRKFTKFIESFGFVKSYGSFTDICVVAPVVGVASVNLSVGYYQQHSKFEILLLDELMGTITKVKKILDTKSKRYEHVSQYVDKVNTWNFSGFGKAFEVIDDAEIDRMMKEYADEKETEKQEIKRLTEEFEDDSIEKQIAEYNVYGIRMDGYQLDW